MSPNGAPVPFGGVVTVPASSIHSQIKAQVAKALEGVDKGETMAVLTIQTETGVNIAVAHKFNEQWDAVLYIGKSGWDKPVEYGTAISFSR